MYFVWISEQTAIISLYSINWLVSITETESVYCAVRPGSLRIIQDNRSFKFGGLSPASHRGGAFQSEGGPFGICGVQSGTETGFSPSTSVFPCQYHYTNALHSSSSTCCSYQVGQTDAAWEPSKINALP